MCQFSWPYYDKVPDIQEKPGRSRGKQHLGMLPFAEVNREVVPLLFQPALLLCRFIGDICIESGLITTEPQGELTLLIGHRLRDSEASI
jgi:hypothetical protein